MSPDSGMPGPVVFPIREVSAPEDRIGLKAAWKLLMLVLQAPVPILGVLEDHKIVLAPS